MRIFSFIGAKKVQKKISKRSSEEKIEIIQIIEEGNTNLYKSGIINRIVYNANLDFINSLLDDVINSRQNLNGVV